MSKSRDIADSAATINYIDGLTSDAQGQIDTATSDIATNASDIATNASDIATKAPLSNPTFTGTVTATAFSGDGSGLSNLPATGGQIQAVASGTLANGDTVIVNADGTVSVIQKTVSTTPLAGPPTKYSDGSSNHANYQISVAYDPYAKKILIAYVGQSLYVSDNGYVIVGEVVGNTVSFGQPLDISALVSSLNCEKMSIAFDTNANKALLTFRNTSNSRLSYFVLTIGSNNTASAGSFGYLGNVSVTTSNDDYGIHSVFDPNTNKVLVSFKEPNGYGATMVATITGNTASAGTPVIFRSSPMGIFTTVMDTNSNKLVTAWGDGNNWGYTNVGTISGTSISFGGAYNFLIGSMTTVSLAFDSTSNKIIYAYNNGARVGTVSGTAVSFGTGVSVGTAAEISVAYDSNSNTVVFTRYDNGTKVYATTAKVSGTSLVVGNSVEISQLGASYVNSVFDPFNSKIVSVYFNSAYKSYAVVVDPEPVTGTLTDGNYIGISDGSYASGATATIQTVGAINDAQSGLIAGKKYYVQADGSLADSRDAQLNFTVVAGTAVSSTELIVKG